MKKLVFILLLSVVSANVLGSNSDSLCYFFPCQNKDSMQMMFSELQQQSKELWALRDIVKQQAQEIETLHNDNRNLFFSMESLKEEVDTLKRISEGQSRSIKVVSYDMENQFSKSQRKENLILIVFFVVFIFVVCESYIMFRKYTKEKISIQKLHSGYEDLRTNCFSIQNDIIKMDSLLIQLIDMQTNIKDSNADIQQESHGLVLKIADEIVRIETNLSRMDITIKGYKQLVRAVERIKANFTANGYEIVDLLGKNYSEGMKVTANFVTDETLAEGEQIITGIIKPQINYYGKMIQSAQITVSQNL